MASLNPIHQVHCVNQWRHSFSHNIGVHFLSVSDSSWPLGEVTVYTLKVPTCHLTYLIQVYRDMRHPEKFSRALGVSYGITFAIDMSMGVIGYLMFGKYVFEEVKPLLRT